MHAMVKIYKVLAITKSLEVLLFDCITEEAINAQINMRNNSIPGVYSTLQKSGESKAFAIIGIVKGKQLEPFIQGQDMFYVRNGGSVVEEAKPLTTIDDIVTSTELARPKEIRSLNIYIITNE